MKTGKASSKKSRPKPAPAVTQRSIEADRRALARKARQDRQERLKVFRAQIKGRKRRIGVRAAGTGPLTLLAEGDSWFHYPVPGFPAAAGVIEHLKRMIETFPEPLNLAHYGDEVQDMMGVEQRKRLREVLSEPLFVFDALLFSGGGNDLVGDQLCLWLRDRADASDPAHAFDDARLDNVLQIVEAGYRDLIALRDELAPECVIFAHGYDFPKPSNKGVCGLGPWLKPSMVFRGWTDPDEQFEIARNLLLRFNGLLERFEQSALPGSFVYVRTQGTLRPRVDWANEIHPDHGGFDKIARRFRDALEERFPGRV